MLELSVPSSPEMQEALLEPDDLGPKSKPFERFSLGKPIVVPLTSQQTGADRDITEFLSKNESKRFYLVRLACSFAPTDNEPVTDARLSVNLQSAGGEPPLITSIDPTQVSHAEELKRYLEGSVTLELAGAGLKFGVRRGNETSRGDLFLQGRGLQQSRAEWRMRETGAMRIGGSYAFDLIVCVSSDVESSGDIGAMVQVRRRLLMVPYIAKLRSGPATQFRIG